MLKSLIHHKFPHLIQDIYAATQKWAAWKETINAAYFIQGYLHTFVKRIL